MSGPGSGNCSNGSGNCDDPWSYYWEPYSQSGGFNAIANSNSLSGDGTYWAGRKYNGVDGDAYYIKAYKSGGVWSADPPFLISNDITATTTWYSSSTPYVISGDITINSGVTLTIKPGAVVKFDTATSSSLTVNGALNVQGTSSPSLVQQVFFTSLDDDYWGDTNENGSSTVPSAGDWGGIIINAGGQASFEFTTIRYAGASSTSEAQIYNNGGLLNMEHSAVVYGTTYGVKNNLGTSSVSSTELGFNDYGFYLSGGSAAVSGDNVIHDNSLYGIYNNTGSSVNAENNYWGDSSGPYHNAGNLSGLGNAVSNNVDYDPWGTNLHFLWNFDSVDDDELRWDGSLQYGTTTDYTSEWDNAVNTWDIRGEVNIFEDAIDPTLDVSVVSNSDLYWSGQWADGEGTDTLQLNEFYLRHTSSSKIENTILHELGHALGLGHSYNGNVMYYLGSPQTTLGTQDEDDYFYLWQ